MTARISSTARRQVRAIKALTPFLHSGALVAVTLNTGGHAYPHMETITCRVVGFATRIDGSRNPVDVVLRLDPAPDHGPSMRTVAVSRVDQVAPARPGRHPGPPG